MASRLSRSIGFRCRGSPTSEVAFEERLEPFFSVTSVPRGGPNMRRVMLSCFLLGVVTQRTFAQANPATAGLRHDVTVRTEQFLRAKYDITTGAVSPTDFPETSATKLSCQPKSVYACKLTVPTKSAMVCR